MLLALGSQIRRLHILPSTQISRDILTYNRVRCTKFRLFDCYFSWLIMCHQLSEINTITFSIIIYDIQNKKGLFTKGLSFLFSNSLVQYAIRLFIFCSIQPKHHILKSEKNLVCQFFTRTPSRLKCTGHRDPLQYSMDYTIQPQQNHNL